MELRPLAPIMVKAGDRASRDLALTPTSAIEVRLLDEFGDPAPGVVLQISQRVSAAGAARFLPYSRCRRRRQHGRSWMVSSLRAVPRRLLPPCRA